MFVNFSMKKSWVEKRANCKEHQIKTISKTITDMPSGSLMLIPSTKIVDKFVRNIPKGTFVNFKSLRINLAKKLECGVNFIIKQQEKEENKLKQPTSLIPIEKQ